MTKNISIFAFVFLLASFGQVFAAGIGTNGFTAFETGVFVRDNAYANFKAPPADWPAQSGALRLNTAWETNRSLRWFIEDQQLGGDYVAAGISFGHADEIRWGLKVLEWGFAQMTTNGDFPHSDNYHSAAFFIEATSRALLLVEASSWRAEFKDQVGDLKSKLHLAARWMIRPEVHDKFWNPTKKGGEWPFGHRRYLDAAALGEAGVLCHDQDLLAAAAEFVRQGIAFQRPDGVNPEKGGPDSHYQAYGLLFACRYYALVADNPMRAEMKPMMDKAYAWLLTRIRLDGTVDPTGNTRTGLGQEKARNGKLKGLEYRFTAIALAYWGQMTQKPESEKTAQRVFEADRKLRAESPDLAWDGY